MSVRAAALELYLAGSRVDGVSECDDGSVQHGDFCLRISYSEPLVDIQWNVSSPSHIWELLARIRSKSANPAAEVVTRIRSSCGCRVMADGAVLYEVYLTGCHLFFC